MVELAVIEFPPERETAAPLIVAPGLFGAARNWRAHARRMGRGRRVLAVDMRNHGESPWSDVHDYPAMAADLAELIEREGGRAAVLGHSMGGKAAMALAETRPELLERLIVADIAPVGYGGSRLPEIEAMRAVDLSGMVRRAEVEAALAPAIGEPSVRAFLAQAAVLGEEPRWSLNLDALGANMATLIDYPELGGRYEGPVLMLHGGASDYVLPAHRQRILTRFPAAVFESLDGAAHWIHVDRPREFLNAVNTFLAEGEAA
ncbi:MAG: alpha/beta fold hydrolase [Pikeienuella sp.]